MVRKAVALVRAARAARQAGRDLDCAGPPAHLGRSAAPWNACQSAHCARRGRVLVLTPPPAAGRDAVPWPSLLFGAPPCSRLSTAALWSASPAPAWPAAQAAAAQACACARGRLAAWHQLRGEQLRSWLRHVEVLEQRLVAVAGSLSVLPAGQVRAPCWRAAEDAARSVFARPSAHSLPASPGRDVQHLKYCSPSAPACRSRSTTSGERNLSAGVAAHGDGGGAAGGCGAVRAASARALPGRGAGRPSAAGGRALARAPGTLRTLLPRRCRGGEAPRLLHRRVAFQGQCSVCSSLCLLAPPSCSTQRWEPACTSSKRLPMPSAQCARGHQVLHRPLTLLCPGLHAAARGLPVPPVPAGGDQRAVVHGPGRPPRGVAAADALDAGARRAGAPGEHGAGRRVPGCAVVLRCSCVKDCTAREVNPARMLHLVHSNLLT